MDDFREVLTVLSKVALVVQPEVTYSMGFDAGGRPFLLLTTKKDGVASVERMEANDDDEFTVLLKKAASVLQDEAATKRDAAEEDQRLCVAALAALEGILG